MVDVDVVDEVYSFLYCTLPEVEYITTEFLKLRYSVVISYFLRYTPLGHSKESILNVND